MQNHRFARRAAATAAAVTALAIATATAASADGGPVAATVNVATGLTLTGSINPVDFGSITVGQTITRPGAQQFQVATNSAGGFTVSLINPADSAWDGPNGLPTGPGYNAVSVQTTDNGGVKGTTTAAAAANGTALLDSGSTGTTTVSEDWMFKLPGNFNGVGAYHTTYTLTVAAA